MIIFLGDSFTWGQGLQIPYWLQQGKSIEECNRLMPPKFPSETYDYHSDEYRKKHHFPNLVAKHFNKSYSTKWGNGGSNEDIKDIVPVIGHMMDTSAIDCFVIQFTELTRDKSLSNVKPMDGRPPIDFFEGYINSMLQELDNRINGYYGKPWFGFSWFDDIGSILEKKYPTNYIPIEYKDTIFNNFDELFINYSELTLAGEYKGIMDGHFNSLGHQVISNSIIKKLQNIL